MLKQYGELPEHIRINDTDVMFEGEDKENQVGLTFRLFFGFTVFSFCARPKTMVMCAHLATIQQHLHRDTNCLFLLQIQQTASDPP